MMRARAILLLTVLVATSPAYAQDNTLSGQVSYPLGSTPAEQWVLDEARQGRDADLSKVCGDDGNLNSRSDDDDRWKYPCRKITAQFIKTIITQEPWRGILVKQGLRLIQARIDEPLDLLGVSNTPMIWIKESRFEGGGSGYPSVVIDWAKFTQVLSFENSTLVHGLMAHGLQVDGTLWLKGAEIRSPEKGLGSGLLLEGAVIRDSINMNNASLEGVDAGSMSVGKDLELNDATLKSGQINLAGARIDGTVHMRGSNFYGSLQAKSIRIGKDLEMREAKLYDGCSINLEGASIDGSLHLNGTMTKSGIWAPSLRVGTNLWLANTELSVSPILSGARIGGSVYLGRATLPGADLTDAVIAGALVIAGPYGEPKWLDPSRLVLRNTQVGTLSDSRDAWPRPSPAQTKQSPLDLQGFIYSRIGALEEDPSAPPSVQAGRMHQANWYVEWLERDTTFARQPYQHLANLMRTAGDPDEADDILYAARERERIESWRKGDVPTAMGLASLRCIIGYGLGYRYFRALGWVLFFTAVGVAVLWVSPSARAKGLPWCAGASLDQLLPIVELNKEFSDFFDDPDRDRLKGWQLTYFAVQAIVGYVLASFVVAGLAGLTQAH
jgi:hypothetical protein